MFAPCHAYDLNRPLARRSFLAGAAALSAAALLPRETWASDAPPHTFQHGDFDVTVVSDGELVLPVEIVAPDAPREELLTLLQSMGQGPKEVRPETNAVLLRKGAELILVDTGSGEGFAPTAGKLQANLVKAGIDPGTITQVIFTHAHPDHIWGTVGQDGKLRYPNATYHVAGREWDFWMDPDLKTKMPTEMHAFVDGAQKHLSAVEARVKRLEPGKEAMPGIAVLDTAGHTPGHISLEVAGGEGLIITADSITNPVVFFAHPEWKFGFDADPDLAVTNRKALLDRAATDKTKLLGFHWPYPGIGYAERKDSAYRYVPLS